MLELKNSPDNIDIVAIITDATEKDYIRLIELLLGNIVRAYDGQQESINAFVSKIKKIIDDIK